MPDTSWSTVRETQKREAAEAAVLEIGQDMVVGLGTGSTVHYVLAALAQRIAGGLRLAAVATSFETERLARAAGIPIVAMPADGMLDICIDGVDEIDPEMRAIKGAGGAMLREKIVATAARQMIAIADASKRVVSLGGKPIPVEVLPFALPLVERELRALGGAPNIRARDDGGQVQTDGGNLILDCHFRALGDSERLATQLSAIPGVLGHGLFLEEIDRVYLGTASGVVLSHRTPSRTGEPL